MTELQWHIRDHFSYSIVIFTLLLGFGESKRPMNITVRGAGIVLYRGVRPYEYLLIKARYHPFHWSPPKGHHKANETDIQAAVREVEEETGYCPMDYKLDKFFRHELSYIAHGRNKTVVYFLAKVTKTKPPRLSKEHQHFKWTTLEEACELFQHQQMEDLVHAADVNLAMNVPSEECTHSELDFSNIPIASSGNSKSSKG